MTVDPFATCRLEDGWRLRLPCGEVDNEIGIDGQGDPDAPLCELVAGSLDNIALTIACGRIQVSYAGGMGLFDHLKEAIVVDFSENDLIRRIFTTLIDEYQKCGPACAQMMAALMNQCLIEVLREAEKEADGALPWLSALDDPRLSKVVETILENPERDYTLESLADIAAMSRATFVRHFEKSFGRTPMDYVRDVRLRRAAQLLQVSKASVDGVAGKVGYASRSHFSRSFQDQYGVSPADFRKQYH